MKKHLRESNCVSKRVEKYTYLKLQEKYVCPVCIRTFDELSELMEHMSKNWSEEQFYKLGYKKSLYDGYVARSNKR